MTGKFVTTLPYPDSPLVETIRNSIGLFCFDLELTARCGNNCRHCYVNRPAGDEKAKKEEISYGEIDKITNEAVSLGGLWCLLTGGEPLLREDFADIYLLLKKKGIIVSFFTTATLIREEHVKLFKRYPPRDVEITVYGVSEKIYERVTRRKGSYRAFRNGLQRLLDAGIPVRLKTMAMRSNLEEMPEIAKFCREHTKDYFRFDPFLYLRMDRDRERNGEILEERLSAEEIEALEKRDPGRLTAVRNYCWEWESRHVFSYEDRRLLRCGAGTRSVFITHNAKLRLCNSLCHPDFVYDLRQGNLTEAWTRFVPRARRILNLRPELSEKCRTCPLTPLCQSCPAVADRESDEIERPVPYFCGVAHGRNSLLEERPHRFSRS